jgi:PleD family two-component response regulator
VLRELKAERPHIEAIMLTGAAEVGTAVTGMKLGAVDYLLKPSTWMSWSWPSARPRPGGRKSWRGCA